MTTVLERPAEDSAKLNADVPLREFLADLGDISRRYGIAISDGASLYVMEPEDYARSYLVSNESELTFA